MSTNQSNANQYEPFEKSKNNNVNLDFTSINRYYLLKKVFIELDGNSNITNYTFKETSTNYITINSNGNNLNQSLDATAQVGIGRIDPIQDANLAVYILQDLQKKNLLNHDPSANEILAFSSFISQLKNKRIFDSRTKRIYELDVLDSFLTSNNLLKTNNIKAFTIINDNWAYAFNPQRLSGWRSSLVADMKGYRYINNNKTTQNKNDTITTNNTNTDANQTIITIQSNNSYEDPININWQQSVFVNHYFSKYSLNTNSDTTIKYKKNSYGINTGYTLSYYPSSRTTISFANSLNIWKNKQETTNVIDNSTNNWNIMPSSRLNVNYFVSPRIRLSFTCSVSYIKYATNYYDQNITYPFYNSYGTRMWNDSKSLSTSTSFQIVYNIL
jgi:hypothetical protein